MLVGFLGLTLAPVSAQNATPIATPSGVTPALPATFKDATGTIQVEIDDEDWPVGQSVSESAKVRLTGEVERELTGREIDVDRVELLQ